MAATDSFAELMVGLNRADETAAAQIFHRFAGKMLELARRQLSHRLRRKIDPEDVLQSVFRSFFIRHREGRFDIENWENLWGILAIMTMRKCGRQIAHFQAERRDLRREVGLQTPVQPGEKPRFFSADPTPSEALVLTELVEGLMKGLTPADRGILTLYLQGHTTAEIGALVGRSMRTVRRTLERARKRLRRMHEEDSHRPQSH
jgi:RNA polymerase sigma-70 factor (ECF subfamily)